MHGVLSTWRGGGIGRCEATRKQELNFMFSISLLVNYVENGLWGGTFKAEAVVIIGAIIALYVAIVKLLKPRKARNTVTNTSQYCKRFEQMKSEAEQKYGPSVEFLRPEMEIGDDPETFEKAWKQFERDHTVRLTTAADIQND
jgi:hypothetical protein